MTARDIYSTKEWQILYAKREGFELDGVVFSCDEGKVEYEFLKRQVVINGKAYPYCDIITPYAYSGPQLDFSDTSWESRKELIRKYNQFLDKYCKDNGIIAEYVQFNPWMGYDVYFKDMYEMDFRTLVIGLDLSKPDLMMDELNARRRRSVRNAIKQGVEVFFDYEGKMIDEFMRLYEFTLDKYEVLSHYFFNRSFIQEMFDALPGRVSFAYCMFEGKCVSICMNIESEEYAHYHLAGNDPAAQYSNASSLLIYSCAEKFRQAGKKYYILGGCAGEDRLREFKLTFTKDCLFNYYCGKKIWDGKVYNYLKQESGIHNSIFFPIYRG